VPPSARARGSPAPPRLVSLNPDPVSAVESGCRSIHDPVAKLRYLRRSLDRFETLDERFQAVPFAPLRWALYRLTGLERARPLFNRNPNGALRSPPGRRPPLGSRLRRATHWAALLLVVAAGLAIASYPRARPPSPEPARRGTLAETLPPARGGLTPDGVWMVDSGDGWELYSNGLRIDTTHTVGGEPRRYRSFSTRLGMETEVHHRPIGILYHTSESDIWPLEESFNERLRESSQGLLNYLRRNQVYHYLIDRFGQVYRVVKEEDRANHAGMSIWSRGERVWLNLNGPFLGVAFETRWAGGRALPITRAQLEAGRRLTDYLRAKWKIAPDMCVTHGLASVNSQKHLIGHHVDWARGFPFEAYGLPDLYKQASPAVELFGFAYDEQFLAAVGEPWPGVRAAERELDREAAADGLSLEGLRKVKAGVYDRWLSEQTLEAKESAEAGADGTGNGVGGD
jgi:hypothetical protein